jgi:hypothetical protein
MPSIVSTLRRTRRRIAITAILALIVGLNLHLPLLQLVAWSTMIADYSSDRTIAEAVEMTFNGENPCSMCLTIEQERTKTEAPAATLSSSQESTLTLYHEAASGWTHTLQTASATPGSTGHQDRLREPPEPPPPRPVA